MCASCSVPVLRSDLLHDGIRDIPMPQLAQDPAPYTGKLFILGGAIVTTTVTQSGSTVEALDIPVDSAGHLKQGQPPSGMYIGFYASELGVLDPAVYRPGRMITLAGEFTELRPGQMGGKQYDFPFFVIRQIYLWEEGQGARDMPGRLSIGIGGGFGIGGGW